MRAHTRARTHVHVYGRAGAQIWWTYETGDVFDKVRLGDKMGMKRFAVKCSDQLDDLIIPPSLLYTS